MNYKVLIEAPYKKELETAFHSERSKLSRSEVNIKKSANSLLFEIKAEDAIALKAHTNTIISLLTAYEKIDAME